MASKWECDAVGSPAHPLCGLRVLVTRERDAAAELAQALAGAGAEVILMPTIRIEPPGDLRPLDDALARLASYDWVIFTSANAVRAVVERLAPSQSLNASGLSEPSLNAYMLNAQSLNSVRVAAVGPQTQALLAAHGIRIDLVPKTFTAPSMANLMGESGELAGRRVLLPRSQIAETALVDALRAAGAIVDEVVAYQTLRADPEPAALSAVIGGGIDAVTFSSGSTARNFMALVGSPLPADVLDGTVVACIGPSTAAIARGLGIAVDVVAREHTAAGLVAALVDHVATTGLNKSELDRTALEISGSNPC